MNGLQGLCRARGVPEKLLRGVQGQLPGCRRKRRTHRCTALLVVGRMGGPQTRNRPPVGQHSRGATVLVEHHLSKAQLGLECWLDMR